MVVQWSGGGIPRMIYVLKRGRDGTGLRAAGPRLRKIAVDHYRSSHKWQNRSGRMQRGIGGRQVVRGANLTITVYTTPPYAIYPETYYGGRYSSLVPSLYAVLPQILQEAGRAYMSGFR
jgi:hypothetical protein